MNATQMFEFNHFHHKVFLDRSRKIAKLFKMIKKWFLENDFPKIIFLKYIKPKMKIKLKVPPTQT